jgi:hypothetical protein
MSDLRKAATEVTPQVTPEVTPEVGLTDEERFSKDWQETVARVEAKLKEKNT